jgi:hypothetical protein
VGIEIGSILATAPLTTTASRRKSTIETVSKTSLHDVGDGGNLGDAARQGQPFGAKISRFVARSLICRLRHRPHRSDRAKEKPPAIRDCGAPAAKEMTARRRRDWAVRVA